MKLALLGKFHTENGMGLANIEIKKELEAFYEVSYSKETRLLRRLWELCGLVLCCDVLVICTSAFVNYPAVWLAELQKKRYVYLMHGLVSYENCIDYPPNGVLLTGAVRRYERFILKHAGRVICVSELLMNWIGERFPFCLKKLDFVYNTVDIERCESIRRNSPGRVPDTVLSAGGGRRQKNILTVASALEDSKSGYILHVAGREFSEAGEIRSHRNVVWHGNIPHDDFLALMAASSLYVQNSTYETFGIAVVEALFCGCSILVSENTGCLPLFGSIRDEDIIRDVHDKEEISRKIRHLMTHPNNARLREGFSADLVSAEYRSKKLKEIIDSVL
ncbi:MAG: glycosyltransferase family 4 protein [Lachnospiraceae bacterium]|nr:glycosyltransferase family 4 protein [Lachnospiraceae bacterium]